MRGSRGEGVRGRLHVSRLAGLSNLPLALLLAATLVPHGRARADAAPGPRAELPAVNQWLMVGAEEQMARVGGAARSEAGFSDAVARVARRARSRGGTSRRRRRRRSRRPRCACRTPGSCARSRPWASVYRPGEVLTDRGASTRAIGLTTMYPFLIPQGERRPERHVQVVERPRGQRLAVLALRIPLGVQEAMNVVVGELGEPLAPVRTVRVPEARRRHGRISRGLRAVRRLTARAILTGRWETAGPS